MRGKLKLLDVQLKLALLIIFCFFYGYAISFPEKSRSFPQLISVVSMIMVLISLFFDFTRHDALHGEIIDVDDAEVKVLDEETKKARKLRFYRAWGIIIVSSAAGFLGGFLFSTFFFFLGFTLFFGERKNLFKNIGIAVAMTVIIYVSFETIMGVPLLDGILW